MSMIKILDPVASTKAGSSRFPLSCLDDLKGKRIAFLSNEWRSLLVILRRLEELLAAQSQVTDTFTVVIPHVHPATKETLDDTARTCDAAIVGFANWGGCTAWSVHAAAEMVKRKIPTVLLVNEHFLSEARLVAKSLGVPDLPYVVFPHNVETISDNEIKVAADKVFPDIVRCLTRSAPVVSGRPTTSGKFSR